MGQTSRKQTKFDLKKAKMATLCAVQRASVCWFAEKIGDFTFDRF